MIYCFDIDNTILKSTFNGDNYLLITGNMEMVRRINKLYDKGHAIIIQTGRHWNYLLQTKSQLDYLGLKYHSLVMGKPPFDISVDDKNLTPGEFLNEHRRSL